MKAKINHIVKLIRRNKAITRTLCVVLSLIMVFHIIPSTIFSEASELLNGNVTGDGLIQSTEDVAGANSLIDPFEVVELREEYTKHFRLSDGSYVAAQYNYPIHSLDENGEWQDIDNELSKSGSEFSNESARIKFAKKINGSSNLFTMHDGNTKITLNLIGAERGTKGTVTNGNDEGEETELQKMLNLEKLSASILYENILDGVDLEYVAYSMNIKENIIVKEKKDSYSYSFELKLNGLTPTLTESGNIELTDDDTGEVKYVIPAPTVFDANGVHAPSDVAAYTLVHENGKKYILTVSASSDWMNAEERVFPITVDPAVMQRGTSVIDVNINSANPTVQTNDVQDLTVMDNNHTMLIHWKMTSLPTVPTSARIIEAYVSLCLRSGYGAYVGAYEVLKDWDSTLTWESYKNTSNPQGSTLTNLVDYQQMTFPGYYDWNITELAIKWYRDSYDNFGVAFGSVKINNTSATFYSNETNNKPALTVIYRDMKGIESYWPYFSHNAGTAGNGNVNLANGNLILTGPTVTATDNIFGYTPYLTYDSSMSNKPYYYANANIALSQYSVGMGFKLSVNETLMLLETADSENTAETISIYVYSDSDGTEHYFYEQEDSAYRDEDGLGMILTVGSNGKISIEDETKIKRHFSQINDINSKSCWILESIEDTSGNQLVFTYRAPHMPTAISLKPNGSTSTISLLELWYDQSTDMLTMVYDATRKAAAVFRYSDSYNSDIDINASSYLRQIDYAIGNSYVTSDNWINFISNSANDTNINVYESVKYNYNSYGKITEAINVNGGTSLKYSWINNKVYKISEYGGTTLGNEVDFLFRADSTVVTDNGNDGSFGDIDDTKNCYVLDDYGRCVGVYSSYNLGDIVYGTSHYSYDTGENSKNSIKTQATVGDHSANYVINGSFEDLNGTLPLHWRTNGDVRTTLIGNVTGTLERSIILRATENFRAEIDQKLILSSGTYTLSFPMYVTLGEGITVRITVQDCDTNEIIHTENITPIPYSSETLVSSTFTISGGNNYRNVTLTITLLAPSDSSNVHAIEIDSVMLSNSIGATSFNFIEYGSFDSSLVGSDGNATAISTDYWSDEDGNPISFYESYEEDRKWALLKNTDGGEKYIKQTVYEASTSKLIEYDAADPADIDTRPHTFAISGFADISFTSRNKPMRLKVQIVYYRGVDNSDYTDVYVFDLLSDNKDMQFISGNFTLGYTQNGNRITDYLAVKSITIYCDCSYNYGAIVIFNDIAMTYAGVNAVTTYEYTEDGKVKSILSGNNGQFYGYNEHGNIDYIADNSGHLTKYVYDNIHTNQVNEVIEYDFTFNGTGEFPYYLPSDPLTHISKTFKQRIVYEYNTYGLITSESTYLVETDEEITLTSKKISNAYTYITNSSSKIFGALNTETNSSGITTRYYYNSMGLLAASINISSGIGTYYVYNAKGQIIEVYPARYNFTNGSYTVISDEKTILYNYDSSNNLSGITDTNTVYHIGYDEFGNVISIETDNRILAEYEYGEHNGKLERVYNGSGYVEYVYNDLDHLIEIWYNGDTEASYLYEYNSNGSLYKIKDNVNGVITVYKYDANGSVSNYTEYDAATNETKISTSFTYDDDSRLDTATVNFSHSTSGGTYPSVLNRKYTYNSDNLVSRYWVSYNNSLNDIQYSYDDFDRLSRTTLTTPGFSLSTAINYKNVGSNTTGLIRSYANSINGAIVNGYVYEYDGNNNITKITDSYGKEIRYTYDIYGQLLVEENEPLCLAFVYTYDDYGNILTKTIYELFEDGFYGNELEHNVYTYSADNCLLRYNNNVISYNSSGNPLSYYNGTSYRFVWNDGKLSAALINNIAYRFTYNDVGLRTSKIDRSGNETVYLYSGDLLICEYDNSGIITYIYDAFDSPIGFTYRATGSATEEVYWYQKNLQGDIVAVYDDSGTMLVSYVYDAWGNFSIAYYNNGEATSATKNNITYRGYYYDSDLGVYYLHSRYYDPAISRFISPDDPRYLGANGDLTSYNLYAYCSNNPINYIDSSGYCWIRIKDCLAYALNEINSYIAKAKTISYDIYYVATEWHFETRAELNGEHPKYEEVSAIDSPWTLLPGSQSIYHDNHIGKPEEKYVLSDGREAVFDGDTLEPITDPRYIATYNYSPVYQLSDSSGFFDYGKVIISGIGHFFVDMLPYYLTGNSNTRQQFESKFSIFD